MKLNVGQFAVFVNQILHKYNEKKYWRYRQVVVLNRKGFFFKIKQTLYLIIIKRSDAFNNASMGTDMGGGAKFITPPHLPHGLNGIIISRYANIGSNCKIYQQVTITTEKHVVTKDVPSNCSVGGIPAKILRQYEECK